MMYVRINDESFIYDVHSLVKAFYPAQDIKVVTGDEQTDSGEGLPEFVVYAGDDRISVEEHVLRDYELYAVVSEDMRIDRSKYKSELKRQLYRALSEYTGLKLPWGTLTGIRPTKLAMESLNRGMSREEVISYMEDFYLCSAGKAGLAADIAIRERDVLRGLATESVGGADDHIGISDIGDILAEGYSLYIGIPFCPSRCMYCSFMSYPAAACREAIAGYIDALKKEIDYVAEAFAGRRLDSIYIGGGTPTTLDSAQLTGLIAYVRDNIDMTHVREFTVEAGRADSIDEEKLKTMLALGVDRISINPQTFNEDTLKLIGRRATAADTIETYELARRVGYHNINMDIILGLPGESMDDVRHTLDVIRGLKPDDLTVHSLAVKRGSRLAELLMESDNDTCVMLRNSTIDYEEAMALTEQTAADIGLKPYYLYRQKNISGNLENTGYAAQGRAGIYNILMMEEVQDIVACGAGTVSKHVAVQPDGNVLISRCDTHKDLKLYMNDIPAMTDRKRRLYREYYENEGEYDG